MNKHVVKIIRTSSYGVIVGDISENLNTVKFGWIDKQFHPSEFVIMDNHHFDDTEVFMANIYAIKKINSDVYIPESMKPDYENAYKKVYESNIDASTNLLLRSLELAEVGIVWHREHDDI